MREEDVTDPLDIALAASGCDNARVLHKPRRLGDIGSSCIAGGLADYLKNNGMKHLRGAPVHTPTQRKIERWHQTLKTASFGKITPSKVNWKPPSQPSSTTVTPAATTRALAT